MTIEQSFEEKLKITAERLMIDPEQIPRHIAIIMDGNGRWAQRKGMPRIFGHHQGGKTVEKIALHCVKLGIECLTLYSFSTENWKRPREEVEGLMDLYSQYLINIRPVLKDNNVKLVHLGQLERLPESVKTALLETMEFTGGNTGMTLAIALNYSGRTEIVDAVRKIARECKDGGLEIDKIDEKCIDDHLYTAKLQDPDLLIRTADELRISNFLLWQISYTEFYITKRLWPDFSKSDIEKAIVAYSKRNRRFGGIKTSATK